MTDCDCYLCRRRVAYRALDERIDSRPLWGPGAGPPMRDERAEAATPQRTRSEAQMGNKYAEKNLTVDYTSYDITNVNGKVDGRGDSATYLTGRIARDRLPAAP